MSFLRAAYAARLRFLQFILPLAMAGFFLSCGGSNSRSPVDPDHNAYVTLPQTGSVLLLHINGTTGSITMGPQTPAVQDATPTGLALLPSKKFLYVANSFANSISIFQVASDGTLALTATPIPAGGASPNGMVIDPTGTYLLVTNNLTDNISVFSIDPDAGTLTPTAGSPFYANTNPTDILITPSGNSVYVTNPGIGMVTAFAFADGVLTQLPSSPVFSGQGASGVAVDATGQHLYVANPLASNLPLYSTIGNVSGFNIDPVSGALTPILGSPFASDVGTGPTSVAVDPTGRFVYAVSTGSSFSIWCFAITPSNGQLVAVTNSPFSLAAGGLFALFDPSGNFLYIGNASGNGIEGYTYNSTTGAPTVIADSPFSTGSPPGKMVLSH